MPTTPSAIAPAEIHEHPERDRQPDEQEHERRQQEGDELPGLVERRERGVRQADAPPVGAQDDPGDDGRDDARLAEPVGDEVRPVSQHDRDRQLDQPIPGVGHDPRRHDTDDQPQHGAHRHRRDEPDHRVERFHRPGRGTYRDEEDTTAVPSLNRLSASTSVASRAGAPRVRNVAMTETGSVAETMAPTMNASDGCSPVAVRTSGDDAGRNEDARDGQDRRPDEGLPELGDVEPVRRLEHEPGHEDDEHELGRDREMGRRPDPGDDQPEQDERDAVRQAGAAGQEGDERGRRDEGDEQLHDLDGCVTRLQGLAADRGEGRHRRRNRPGLSFESEAVERRRPACRRMTSISPRYGRPMGIRSSHSRNSRFVRAISPSDQPV